MAAAVSRSRMFLPETGAGGNLNYLLVAPLQAAFPFPQVADSPRAITYHLNLHVTGLSDQLFHIELSVTKGRLCLGLTNSISLIEPCWIIHSPHAASPPPAKALIMTALALPKGRMKFPGFFKGNCPFCSRQQGYVAVPGQTASLYFVAEQFKAFSRRTNERQPFLIAASGKRRILAQKSIPGVKGRTLAGPEPP